MLVFKWGSSFIKIYSESMKERINYLELLFCFSKQDFYSRKKWRFFMGATREIFTLEKYV